MELIEPNPPTVGVVGTPGQPDPRDNLDAVDFETGVDARDGPVFFSLDSGFPDPLETTVPPANDATAISNGFVGGDVLVGTPGFPGTPLGLYATASLPGLD